MHLRCGPGARERSVAAYETGTSETAWSQWEGIVSVRSYGDVLGKRSAFKATLGVVALRV